MSNLYSDVLNGARNACATIYQTTGGDPSALWTVRASGPTASMGRDTVRAYKPGSGWVPVTRWDLNLPGLPLDARLSPAEGKQITAYWLHEVCHSLWTNYDAWKDAVREGLGPIVNGLEDPRIERTADRRGLAPGFRDLINSLITGLTLDALSGGWTPADPQNIPFTLAVYGRVRLSGISIPGLPDYHSVLQPRDAALLDEALRRLELTSDGPSGTAEVLDIARWFVAQLPAGRTTAPQPGQGDGEDDGQGPQGPAEGDGQGPARGPKGDTAKGAGGAPEGPAEGDDGEGDDGEGDDGEGDDAQGSGDDDAPEGEGQAEGGSQGSNSRGWTLPDPRNMKSAEPDLGELAKRVTARSGAASRGDEYLSAWQPQQGVDLGPCMVQPVPGSGLRRLSGTEGAAEGRNVTLNEKGRIVADKGSSFDVNASRWLQGLGNTAKLRFDIARMVKATDSVGRLRHRIAGRLDAHALARGMAGAENIMSKRTEAPGVNTAVLILLDISGSMSGQNAMQAGALALAMGEALSGACVPFAIAGFGNPGDAPNIAPMNGGSMQGFGFVGTTLFYAKPFNAPWRARRGAVVKLMTQHCSHGTHIAPAIMQGAQALADVKTATRRVAFILTDGQDGHPDDAQRRAVELAKLRGVECCGMGIGVQLSKWIWGDNCLTVHSAAQIASGGLGLLAKVLERGPGA